MATLTLHQRQTVPPPQVIALGVAMLSMALLLLWTDTTAPITLAQAGGSLETSAQALCAIRTTFACTHFSLLAYMVRMEPMVFPMIYKPKMGSKLKDEKVVLGGLRRMSIFFTIWTYTAQGVYFTLAALCSATLALNVPWFVGPRILYAMQLLFEMTAGCGFVVTVVVTFVIWPEKLRDREPHDLHLVYNIMMHNTNTLETATELILGRVPIVPAHAAVGILWGSTFIIFSWCHGPMLARLAKGKRGESNGNGTNFPYFFLDITLPLKTQFVCLLGLLATLLVFYFGAMGFRALVLRSSGSGLPLWARSAMTYALAFGLTKWRD